MSISDDIQKFLQWAGEAGSAIGGAYAAGKIAKSVYDGLMSKLGSIESKIDTLEEGGEGIVEEGELVAEITGDAAELVAEGTAAGVTIAAM